MTSYNARLLSLVLAGFAAACAKPSAADQNKAEPAPPTEPSVVSTAEPARQYPRSLEQILAGRISGVVVTAAPGGGIIVRMGGPTSFHSGQDPLFVIDGAPMAVTAGTLSWLNPSDVESIKALKGADASIYGVRGANGVIVIRTKGSH